MDDAILVLNAGSSSIKFSLFPSDGLEFKLGGQIEALYSSPLIAKDAQGKEIARHEWDGGTRLGHAGAIDHLIQFLRSQRQDSRLIAVGHRGVHGGPEFSQLTLVSPQALARPAQLF
jgi:acetate kinase